MFKHLLTVTVFASIFLPFLGGLLYATGFPTVLQHTYGVGAGLGMDIAVDSNGNVHMTGFLFASTGWDVSYAKFSSTGGLICYRRVNVYDYDRGFGIAVDPAGNAYIAGSTSYDSVLRNNADILVIKIDSSCNVAWMRLLGVQGSGEEAWDITVDPNDGNIVLVGWTRSFDAPNNEPDGFVSKINPVTGNPVGVARIIRGNSVDGVFGVAADGTGIYVAGHTNSINGRQGFVAKLDSSLSLVWGKVWPINPMGFNLFSSVAVSGDYLFAAGDVEKPNTRDAALVKIDKNTGDQIWAATWLDPANTAATANGVTIDSNGVYIAGIARTNVTSFIMDFSSGGFVTQIGWRDGYGFVAGFDFNGNHLHSTVYHLNLASKPSQGYFTAITYSGGKLYAAGFSEQYPIPQTNISPSSSLQGPQTLPNFTQTSQGQFQALQANYQVTSPTPTLDNPPNGAHAAYIVAEKRVVQTVDGTRTITRVPERCACIADLNTGSLNFTAKAAGTRENPIVSPPDWLVRMPDGSLERPWVVNPVSGAWYSSAPVGLNAMWINPYRPSANNQPQSIAPGNTNYTYSIVFNAPSAGKIYLRGGSDDPGWVYLNGVYTGINIPGYNLWPSPQPGWWVIPVNSGVQNLSVVVRNIPANSPTGLLIEGFYCAEGEAGGATTVTVTTTTTATTTLPRTTTVTTTQIVTTAADATVVPPTTKTVEITTTQRFTETTTQVVVGPATATTVVETTKTVQTTVREATTVKETTTIQTTATQTVTGKQETPQDVLTQISTPPTSTVLIIGLLITTATSVAYLVIKTKSTPP